MSVVDWWTRGVALASLVVSVGSAAWAVVSWRRSGGYLRVHALMYRRVLLLWVFNAGRATVTIERAAVGGPRGGVAGEDLGAMICVPVSLEPGRSRRFEIDATALSERRRRYARGGWDSIWLLLGSMQQRRVELLPIRADRPPRVGWRLAPRTLRLRRWLPLVPAAAVLVGGGGRTVGIVGGTLALLFALARTVVALVTDTTYGRLRVERWLAWAAVPIVVIEAAHPQPLPRSLAYVASAYLLVVVVIVWPGAVPAIRDAAMLVRSHAVRVGHTARARLRMGSEGEPP